MIERIPATVSVEIAAVLLGVSRTTAYQLAANNELPVAVLRVGRKLRVPTALLAGALGLEPEEVVGRIGAISERPDRPQETATARDGPNATRSTYPPTTR